jgi:hypothetical protein
VNFGYLLVEGPHDAAFVGKLLKLAGFLRIQERNRVDAHWEPLIPTTFPHKGDLLKRMPVPTFYQNERTSIALHVSIGDGNIANALQESFASIPAESMSFVGIILDADSTLTPAARFQGVKNLVSAHIADWPGTPGLVAAGPPRTGIYVLPDNQNPGTLEDLLLEAAAITWPETGKLARNYVTAATEALSGKDLAELQKPAGPNKAIAASISNLLRPGKAIQVSLEDNNWLSPATLSLPRIAALQNFLHQLIGLP